MRLNLFFILGLLLLFVPVHIVAQDVRVAVYLRNGERLEGVVEVADEKDVFILAVEQTRIMIPSFLIERVVELNRELKVLLLCHPDVAVAEQMKERLERGDPPDELILKSYHPSVATKGETDFLKRERFPEPLATALFSADENETVGPVEVNGYFYIARVIKTRWTEPEKKGPKPSEEKPSREERVEQKMKEKPAEVKEPQESGRDVRISILPFTPKNSESDVERLPDKVRLSVQVFLSRVFPNAKIEEKAEGEYLVSGEVGAKDDICSLRLLLNARNGEVIYDSGLQTLLRKELDEYLEAFVEEMLDRLKETLNANPPDKKQP